MTSCRGIKDVKKGICAGVGCCEIGINNVARDASVLLDTSTDSYPNKSNCIYAFVVQKEEFNFSATILAGKWDVDKLPVVLDWIIPDQTCNATCQGNTICVSVNVTANSEGYRCGCKEGYEGNPYLSPGCQDIDECVNGQNNCSINSICSNTEGSYECHCEEGYHGDGKGESGCQLPKDDCKDNGKGCTSSKRMIIEHFIGIALCTVLLISGFCLYLGYRRKKSTQIREKFFRENGGLILKQKIAQGRRAVIYDGPMEERSLYEHFLSSLKTNQLFKILDDNIVCEGNTEELQEVALLARRCLNVKGEERPTMKEVAVELSGLRRAAKHSWVNNSDTSKKSHALFTDQPPSISSGYIDATFSITSEYDSLKHHMELPMTTAR
nr:putative wall-associated receptor kinase-like 16 [Ipomoea batatas]